MRLLGIDYGFRKIGMAIGDDESHVAVPLEVIQNYGDFTIKELAERIHDEDIDIVVVGVPLSKGGRHGEEQLKQTRDFIHDLKKQTTVPIFEEDESFTSAESQRIQREEKSGVLEDALAASLILQAFLNR